jgi:hypothetical protein
MIAIEDAARFHFVPVVIFGVDPEHGDGWDLVLDPHAFGELDCGQRFEQREEWAAKQASLLTGDDRHRPRIGEEAGCGDCFRRCVTPLLLCPQDLDERVPLSPMTRSACNGVSPCTRIARVAGEEIGQPREVERVVGREPPDPREATNIYRKTTARGRVPAG